jgi:hypothetical protein
MLEEEKRLQGEIQRLLETAEATDQQEDQEYGAEADGYQVGQELARRQQRLKKIQEAKAALEARERQEHPGETIDPKKQISFADPDARCFAKPGDGTRYVYNAQAAVDMDSQIIVANHIEDSVSDAHAAAPILERMEQEQGQAPEVLVADAGYGNQDTLDSCQQRGVTPVCATTREGKEDRESGSKLDRFGYEYDQDRFVCPHGHIFQFAHDNPTSGERTYKSGGPVTCACGHYQSVAGRAVIRVGQSHLAKRELQRIMDEPGHRELYRRRKCTAEPPFGQIKAGMGFRRFLYRGRQKVGSEWNLVCAAFNVRKMGTLLRGRGRPANPGHTAGGKRANGPLWKLPPLKPFFPSRSGLLASLTRWARPPACKVAPLAHGL